MSLCQTRSASGQHQRHRNVCSKRSPARTQSCSQPATTSSGIPAQEPAACRTLMLWRGAGLSGLLGGVARAVAMEPVALAVPSDDDAAVIILAPAPSLKVAQAVQGIGLGLSLQPT